MDLASGGDDGWMWWSAVLRIVGLRKREIEERVTERERERGRIKNDKERIFK